jgi:hypothetical protein
MGAEVFSFAEQRLLLRARRGEPVALDALWAEVADDLWSVAAGALPEARALDVLAEVKDRLRVDLRGAGREARWRALAFGALWRALWAALGLPPLERIDPAGWPAPGAPLVDRSAAPKPDGAQDIRERLRAAVDAAAPELKVIYLFDLLSGCSAAEVAGFAGSSETKIRQARAAMAYHLVRAVRS